ncbi:hypothetical protein H4R24_004850 [Coemansia sp. RSA 988]|nr:hypothetical protein H4R24_004850 [Coemansia sp. RSA 988]
MLHKELLFTRVRNGFTIASAGVAAFISSGVWTNSDRSHNGFDHGTLVQDRRQLAYLLCAQQLIKLDGWLVPNQDHPHHPSTLALSCDLRKLCKQPLTNVQSSKLDTDKQSFQIKPHGKWLAILDRVSRVVWLN